MQKEIDTTTTTRPVVILGVNEAGQEADNDLMCQGRTLPWLQDTKAVNVWGSWHVTWRDVFVLDQDNKIITIYNLTDHDLTDTTNYAHLKGVLLNAAR